jgi:hypothetical protein
LRFAAAFVLVLACLVVPGTAAAHSRTPAVALDYRLQLSAQQPAGVHAVVIDGDRALRLRVDPPFAAVVRGLLGEDVLRFGADGVWVNTASPTAAADKLVPSHATGWVRLARGRTLTWHDHRLAPPPLRPGGHAPWSLTLILDGQPVQLRGTFTRVAPPVWWPWLAAAALAGVVVTALVRRLPRRRVGVATALAGLAAIGALASSTGFAMGDAIASRAQWLEVASAVVLALVAGAAAAVVAVLTPTPGGHR